MATTATTTTYQYPYPLGGDSLSNVATRIKELADRMETIGTTYSLGTTPSTSDSSTKIASTAYVNALIGSVNAGTPVANVITNAMVNTSAAIAYSKLALTGAILNADLAGSIAYSKLNLATSIVNADVATSAAIASSKLDLSTYAGHTVVANLAARPASPVAGQMIYQTDTDELLKYVVDLDGTSRWMIADHDYRRNFVINGGFDVWQRGTSFNPTSATIATTGASGSGTVATITVAAHTFNVGQYITIAGVTPTGYNAASAQITAITATTVSYANVTTGAQTVAGTIASAGSVTTSTANYGADRWQFLQATTSTAAFTRQAITSTDPVGFNYYTRVQRANALSLVTPYTIQTSFESQNMQAVRGKFVTLSFWARAGANYSAASSYLVSNIVTGTGTDNTVGNFTGNAVNTTANNVLTTSWKRFSITTSAVLATTITQLGVSFVFTPTGSASTANDYFDITGVQLEVGSAPSDFEFRDAGEELRRCQRYYFKLGTYSAGNQRFGTGFCSTTSTANVYNPFPTAMRIAPTALEQSGTAANYGVNNLAVVTACTSVPTFGSACIDSATTTFTTGATLVAGQGCQGVNNSSTAAYLGWNAEL